MDNKGTLFIVMPAYNEEANIEYVVGAWYPILDGKSLDSCLVIADSGSTDSTHKILLDLKKRFPKLEILENTGKKHGPKVIALYNYVIEFADKSGKDDVFVFQTDSDGQTSPEEFEWFWNNRNDFDGIFGNRNARKDGALRVFVEKVVCLLLKIYFGVKIPDANAPFRLMNVSTLKKYVCRFDKDYDLPNIMITTFFSFYNERVAFKDVSFKPRNAGKNSINIPNIVKIGWNALGEFRRFKRSMKK